MRYAAFENTLSVPRMNRYLVASNGSTQKAMTLYRINLRLSQELFTVISCFEVALRNAIDQECRRLFGNDWLREGISAGGMFDNDGCRITAECIRDTLEKFGHQYSHSKLVAEFGFGFWRYFFATNQYNATGRRLLSIFPQRPQSSPERQFNNRYFFNQLAGINNLRNRIAHHEPICFLQGFPARSSLYAREKYQGVCELFHWMSIDKSSFLYGLDHIIDICNKIDAL